MAQVGKDVSTHEVQLRHLTRFLDGSLASSLKAPSSKAGGDATLGAVTAAVEVLKEVSLGWGVPASAIISCWIDKR